MRKEKLTRRRQRQIARMLTAIVVSSMLTQTVASNVALAEGVTQESPKQQGDDTVLAVAQTEGKNYAVNGSFEETVTANSGNLKNWFVDGVYPTGWDGIWVAKAPTANPDSVRFSVDKTHVADGTNSLHYTSGDATARFEVFSTKAVVDPAKDYLLNAKVKLNNVAGTATYLRVQAINKTGSQVGSFGSKEGKRLKGTTDGWIDYEIPVQNLPADTYAVKIEVFMEYITGEVWVDDVQLNETYRMSLDQTSATVKPGQTIALTPKFDQEGVDKTIQWTSSDEAVASVDQNGVVTAKKAGTATIKGTIDAYHEVSFDLIVEDPAMQKQYEAIIDNWANRLTGNDMKNPEDEDYKKLMASFKEEAETYWSSLVKVEGDTDTRTTLWDDLNLTVKFVSGSSDSKLSVDFDTAFARIRSMALAYASKGCEYYQNPELKKAIVSSLEWMHEHVYNEDYDVKNKLYGNWWHWEIGMPQKLSDILVLMKKDLDAEFFAKEVATLNNFNEDPSYVYKISGWGPMDMTSGNLMDTALVAALKGALGENSKSLGQAKEAISTVLPNVNSGDGFYEDGSCVQHTNLAYTGGYGSTLLTGIEKILFITTGTAWEVTDPNLSNVYNWIIEGYRPLYRDGAMMDMVTGRGIARPSRSDQTTGRGVLIPTVKLAASAPEELKQAILSFAKKQLKAAIAYNPNYFDGMTVTDVAALKNLLSDDSIKEEEGSYHKVYGAMDKVVHQADNFALGISMYSNRIASFEYGNGENLKGWHMSDGALYLYNGDQAQYAENYWPTVDPHRLAGTTTDHTEGTVSSTWNAHVSTKNWVGGSSVLGKYGSTGMDFEEENSTLTAKKSWFSFDDEVVALGAGIHSSEQKETETIIENRKIKDTNENQLIVNGTEIKENTAVINDASWAYLEGNTGSDSIGYYFPGKTEIHTLREARTGSWRDINSAVAENADAAKPVTKNYVSLAMNHGEAPESAEYSYVLLPNKSAEEVKIYAENANIEVLSNTTDVQAVKEKTLGVTGMNFWKASRLGYVEAKVPASITMEEKDGKVTVGISDPTQKNSATTVKLFGEFTVASQSEGVTVTEESNGVLIQVNTNDTHGKTFEVVLNGVGNPNAEESVRVRTPEFTELWKRSYKQVSGIEPGQTFDLTDETLKAFVDALNKEANGYWEIMNKSDDTSRTEIFKGIKPVLAGGPNANSANLTTTYKYLAKLAQAYCTNGTDLYQKKEVVTEILSAIDFTIENNWYGKHVPTNNANTWYYGNWWDHRIGVPAQLLPIMILLDQEKQLTEFRYNTYMEAMAYQKANDWGSYVSANLADIGLNAMYYAILNEDESLLIKLNERFGKDMFSYVSSGNGWYKDGSYVDHNIYAYTGGYGSVLVSAMSRIVPILANTKYEMKFNDERDNFYGDVIMKGYVPLHADGKLVEAVCGRSITRETSQTSTSAGHIAVFSNAFTGETKAELQSIIKGWLLDNPNIMKSLTRPGELMACQAILEDDTIKPKSGTTSFNSYNYMDKAVQQTDNYKAVVSMHSDKIVNYEYLNTEGMKLWNMSDGALFLYNSDRNQFRGNFWPTVDLLRLPGVTTLHDTSRTPSAGAGTKNPNNYVNSLNMGVYGVTGMKINTIGTGNNRDGLSAKKSYFLFDDEIVAVGSGITSINKEIKSNAETIIENRKIKDDLSNVLTVNGKEAYIAEKEDVSEIQNVNWAHLSGNVEDAAIGYYFPTATTIKALKETRQGYWKDINALAGMTVTTDPVQGSYATMYIDHGVNPEDAGYTYVLLPGKTAEETQQYNENPDIEILETSDEVHAVYEKNGKVTAANFWSEKGATAGKITANGYASVMMQEVEGGYDIVVSDPTHSRTDEMELTFAIPNAEVVEKDDAITVVESGASLKIKVAVAGAAESQTFHLKVKESGCAEHSWGEWTVTKEATCGESGRKERKCNICGEIEEKEIPTKKKHSYGEWKVAEEATCKEAGIKERKCSVCGERQTKEIPISKKHSWGNWVVIKEATITENGMKERVCQVCQKKEQKEVAFNPEHVKPIVSNITVFNTTTEGYTIKASVESAAGIKQVLVATWTEANGQDDIVWQEVPVVNGTILYQVKTENHNGEFGVYHTHIYLHSNNGVYVVEPVDVIVEKANAVISGSAHIQNLGWQDWVSDGIIGTTGKGLRLESIKLSVDSNLSGSIEYRTHVQNLGWQDWVNDGELSGTTGKCLRLEGIQIRLTGALAEKYEVSYRTHVQNLGWQDWVNDGELSGTTGKSLRLEALEIRIVEK